MTKKLGKGFESLLKNTIINNKNTTVENDSNLIDIPIEKIAPNPYQPRKVFDEDLLDDLASSIKSQGLLQPITVRKYGDIYQLISGERRWRATQRIPQHNIQAIVKDVDDRQLSVLALIENLQREDLGVLEQAIGIQRLIEEFNLTHQQAAEYLGKSRASITNSLRLLQLELKTQKMLADNNIEAGHAKLLAALSADEQYNYACIIKNKSLSVAKAAALISAGKNKKNISKATDQYVEKLENKLSDYFGDVVKIDDKNGKGKIIISYKNLDMFDNIMCKLNINKED